MPKHSGRCSESEEQMSTARADKTVKKDKKTGAAQSSAKAGAGSAKSKAKGIGVKAVALIIIAAMVLVTFLAWGLFLVD